MCDAGPSPSPARQSVAPDPGAQGGRRPAHAPRETLPSRAPGRVTPAHHELLDLAPVVRRPGGPVSMVARGPRPGPSLGALVAFSLLPRSGQVQPERPRGADPGVKALGILIEAGMDHGRAGTGEYQLISMCVLMIVSVFIPMAFCALCPGNGPVVHEPASCVRTSRIGRTPPRCGCERRGRVRLRLLRGGSWSVRPPSPETTIGSRADPLHPWRRA